MPAAERATPSRGFFLPVLFSARWARPAPYKGAAVVKDVNSVVPLTLVAQTCVSLAVAGVAWGWFGEVAGVSAALGGATAVVPNGFLAARLLMSNRDLNHRAMYRAAWIGEIGKLFLTVLLFGVIFGAVRPIAPPAVFAGFIAAQLIMFGALLIGDGAPTKDAMTKS
jgi:ATP synthase protein I